MRIAVVGSGISGLVAARLLSRSHEVTVFEASSWIGGHTHTVEVQHKGNTWAIDTGFIVFNDWTYPNFIQLLTQLGVAWQPAEMSFSVHDPATGLEYNGHNLNSLFAQRRNLLSPGFIGMVRDILRFNREATEDLTRNRLASHTTLGTYLRMGHYSERFINHYIVPMGSAIWSMPLEEMLNFPAQFFIRFFRNHGLLSVSDRPQWNVVSGGSSSYIDPLIEPFRDAIHLDCPVEKIKRDMAGVTLQSRRGTERFDRVVLACHSDQALKLLERPSAAEQAILGSIGYASNEVVLHTDTALLPRRRLAWASWNYRLGAAAGKLAAVTYNMNILQGLRSADTFCVSLNQTSEIDPSTILGQYRYAHPQFSLAALAAQQRWDELAGVQHTWYCGAYWGSGFHEDGVVSALRVAEAFGESL